MKSVHSRWAGGTEIEQRTAVTLAIVVALATQYLAPPVFRLQPDWLLPVVALTYALVIAIGGRRAEDPGNWGLRKAALGLGAVLALGNLGTVALLIHRMLAGVPIHAPQLFSVGVTVWVTNVVAFAVIFWELDAGGPVARARSDVRGDADVWFPQYSIAERTLWKPRFLDYVYLALTNATAFSPTDALPLTPRMKVFMGVQSCVALAAIAVVFARGVNVIGA